MHQLLLHSNKLFSNARKIQISNYVLLFLSNTFRLDKLIISLRTAYSTELSLDKEMTSYSDSLDSSSLAVKMYHGLDNKALGSDDYDLGEVQKVQDDMIDTSVYHQLNR